MELLRRDFLLGNVYGGADVLFQLLVFENRSTNAANVPNLTIATQDALGGIERRSVRQDSLDQVCHKLAILWVNAIQVFPNRRRCAGWLEAVNPKQFRRPVVEASSIEGPASHMGKGLS